MSDAVLSILCLVATLVLYYANKKLYRRFHKLPLMRWCSRRSCWC
ncbi:CidA-associated membrane protein CidB [Klebsiella pneumoniae]|uniref:CidA-associated membrane protein CidB n=1 Tax=Klebsiella pneumoniae TaxID=573 RepID=A0A2X3CSI3_KLEPN|nr:CidA-associated membrane protein CidB [Klebsiella pneumoniae]